MVFENRTIGGFVDLGEFEAACWLGQGRQGIVASARFIALCFACVNESRGSGAELVQLHGIMITKTDLAASIESGKHAP